MHRLPTDLRDALKEPIGRLVSEDELLKILKDEEFIVSVGDMVTYTLLKNDIYPVFCVVDFQIKRDKYSSEILDMIKAFGKKTVVVENPAGCITDDLWNSITDAYNCMEKGSLRIEVVGEEDLAALVAIYMAPRDVTIIYGLPNKGVVIVKAIEETKRKVKEILDKM